VTSASLVDLWDTDEACWWKADLPFDLGPDVLLPWQEEILAAGEATGMFRVDRMDRVGYFRERDGDVVEFVRHRAPRLPATDVLVPAGLVLDDLDPVARPGRVATTLITCVGRDGRIVDEWVGDRFDISFDVGLEADPDLARWWTYFSLRTGVWLPWIHEPPRPEPRDNRMLAARNADRLNGFLRRVRRTALDLGGTWTPMWYGRYAGQINEFGVIVDSRNVAAGSE
jgi:hypothetical protein